MKKFLRLLSALDNSFSLSLSVASVEVREVDMRDVM
jgi:hypothetical protein